jgi:hypothetical protein
VNIEYIRLKNAPTAPYKPLTRFVHDLQGSGPLEPQERYQLSYPAALSFSSINFQIFNH